MANQENVAISCTAGAAVVKGRFVKLDSGSVIHCAATTDVPFGVALNSAASGGLVTVVVSGKVDVEAGAAFALGAVLMPDAAGRAQTHTGANTKAGKALQAGAAAQVSPAAYAYATILLFDSAATPDPE